MTNLQNGEQVSDRGGQRKMVLVIKGNREPCGYGIVLYLDYSDQNINLYMR